MGESDWDCTKRPIIKVNLKDMSVKTDTKTEEGRFSNSKLKEGEYYTVTLGREEYLFKAVGNSKNVSYISIHRKEFHQYGDLVSSFSGNIYRNATVDEVEQFDKSFEQKKFIAKAEYGKYIIKNSGSDYVAAIEDRGKIVWTEEIEDILKYLKDETPIYIYGKATMRPQTLKELKTIVK